MKQKKPYLTAENYRILMNCVFVLLIAIVPSIITSMAWLICHDLNIIHVKNMYVIVSIANGLLGGAYFFLFKDAFGEVHKYYRQINSFIESHRVVFKQYSQYKNKHTKFDDEEDWERFLDEIRDIKRKYLGLINGKLSLYFHTQMALISFFMMASFFARSYEDRMEGVTWIFVLSYIMTALFLMSKVMENPIQGWFRTKDIDLEWLKDEI